MFVTIFWNATKISQDTVLRQTFPQIFTYFSGIFSAPYLYKNFAGKIGTALLYCLFPYDQTLGIP